MQATWLRAERDDDHDFLFQLYASTREEELRPVPWSADEKLAFLKSQLHAQTTHYRAHYPGAQFEIIMAGEVRAGRLYVWRQPEHLSVVDISLIREYRGYGIGGTLLKQLLAEADEGNVSAVIHVERVNRAQRLYERLGFRLDADLGVYLRMRYTPAALADRPAAEEEQGSGQK